MANQLAVRCEALAAVLHWTAEILRVVFVVVRRNVRACGSRHFHVQIRHTKRKPWKHLATMQISPVRGCTPPGQHSGLLPCQVLLTRAIVCAFGSDHQDMHRSISSHSFNFIHSSSHFLIRQANPSKFRPRILYMLKACSLSQLPTDLLLH
ncbi:hypothetical protein FI667_g4737, partial [Globisporangium splendens]